MPVIEAIQVTKHYEEGGSWVPVLKGVDLALERGEIVALEGPSGSGKTTLLFILGCLLTPSSGRVIIEGATVDSTAHEALTQLRKRSIGLVFQHFNLLAALSAMANVEYALYLKGSRGREARREARRLIELVGLADRARLRPRDLSGGEKQRVAIARALAGSTSTILADEPTSSLDSQMGEEILGVFRSVAEEENRSVLIVTHDPKVRKIADRVVHIRDGHLFPGE
jgi:putative ABC transport system ATP-binding protein